MMTLKVIKPTDPDYHKPLDALIEDLGHAEPANQHGDVIITVEDLTDAIHYLQTYQRIEDEYEELKDWWAEEHVENVALSWDELKQMEGKPVWIEAKSLSVGVSSCWKDWYIIKSFSNDEFMHCNDGYEWANETQGRLWQAYRKERK